MSVLGSRCRKLELSYDRYSLSPHRRLYQLRMQLFSFMLSHFPDRASSVLFKRYDNNDRIFMEFSNYRIYIGETPILFEFSIDEHDIDHDLVDVINAVNSFVQFIEYEKRYLMVSLHIEDSRKTAILSLYNNKTGFVFRTEKYYMILPLSFSEALNKIQDSIDSYIKEQYNIGRFLYLLKQR